MGEGTEEKGLTCGSAPVTWLSPILENISLDYVSGCGVCFAVIATVSAARSDGATDCTRYSIKMSQLGCTFVYSAHFLNVR